MGKTKQEFNASSKLRHEIIISVGDWGQDGHEKYEEVAFQSSHPVEAIRAAYLKAVKKTGLSFDSGHGTVRECTEYDQHGLSKEAQRRLKELGYKLEKIENPDYLQPTELCDMILWLAQRELPGFEYKIGTKKEKVYLNGFGKDTLKEQFGYGLFD